jgi:putative ABC transport system permease protein
MVESVLLSLSAALAGLALAYVLVRLFSSLSLAAIPRLEETSIDFTAFLFALTLGVLAGLASGVLPALRSHRSDLNSTLKQAGGRATESRTEQQLRQLFVALETGLAAVLLIECGLFVKSFVKASEINPHFATDHLLTAYLALPSSRYGLQHLDRIQPFVHSVLGRVRAFPGVTSAAAASDLPLTGTAAGSGVLVEGQALPAQIWKTPYVVQAEVSPQFFKTLKIHFIAGADFDYRNSNAKIAIVNQALVRKLFSNQDPLGKRIALVTEKLGWRQIVGVVADVPQTSIEEKAEPELFFPMTTLNARWLALVIRVTGDPLSYLDAIRKNVAGLDPSVAVFLPRTMEQIVEKQLQWRGLQTWVVGAFAFLASTLASLGVYSVIAYSVGQRKSEIGLRMALGASGAEISRMILWQGIRPAVIGAAVGLFCGFALARVSASLLFETTANDATVYVFVAALLVLISGLASFLPAIRASGVEPWKALRHE